MLRKGLQCLWALVLCCGMSAVQAQVVLDPFVVDDAIRDIKISPTGTHFAAVLPQGEYSAIAVIRRSDRALVGSMRLPRDNHIGDFWWVNDERLVFSLAERFGSRDTPTPTGEIYGMNLDGSRQQLLVGYRVRGAEIGSRLSSGAKAEFVHARVADLLRSDPKAILVAISPFTGDPQTRVDRMDVYSGRRTTIATVPVTRANFVADSAGEIRMAVGARADNLSQLYYRPARGSEWTLINHQGTSGRVEYPIGFSEDGRTAYLQATRPQGPDAIVAYDVASGERRELLRDDVVDPEIMYRPGTSVPIGALFTGAKSRIVFFDESSDDARTFRMLEQAFPGQTLRIASSTWDAATKMVQVSSDVDPGSFYTFETATKHADFTFGLRDGIDPRQMAPMRAVSLQARDGLPLHGYLTRPVAATGPGPLIVLPHGGPFGIHDDWVFDPEVQLLAAAGYSVLQVNFRGSGHHGHAFQQAGARQWGLTMQDDLTDATRWAIAQGHADAERICIYGGSYGAYAALMGAVREPSLYRCAVGYVGVYDLQLMRSQDRRAGRWVGTWLNEWVGTDAGQLARTSPNLQAERIQVPVFLAAGGRDEIAPIEHTRRMERALKAANVPVETLYVASEGHGFYAPDNRRAYYTKLLDFLATHLGGERAAP
ncbi:prolyl oligopeptidase family serine peptidase [Luteimonas sp. XNQY3]|nr:prolyl oligopeptidase family serine peptidase [Luteimonas sp. XNQY3]MCD9005283.1 prolyl oligopeptidase family serine peptidase [Luteimonas sp. XNQY3]